MWHYSVPPLSLERKPIMIPTEAAAAADQIIHQAAIEHCRHHIHLVEIERLPMTPWAA